MKLKVGYLFSISLAVANSAPPQIDFKCTLKKCLTDFTFCAANKECRTALGCLAQCGDDSEPRCAYDCGYFDEELPLAKFIDCQSENQCSNTTTIGRCYGKDDDADQSLTSISQIHGVWWSVKGLDCGGSSGPGWDAQPCTKLDISTNAAGESRSNGSFCFGSGSTCQSEVLAYDKELKLRAPGVLLTKYFVNGSKVPRFERQRVLALAGDFALISTCSRAKTFRVHNMNVFSKNRIFGQISDSEKEQLRQATAKHGVDLDAMCNIDNSSCK